jgi:hypothetical protein
MRRRIWRNIALAAVYAVGAVALALVPAGPANAAGECGSSYQLVGSYPMYASSGSRGGTLEIYWSSYYGRNCAINRAYNNYGVSALRTVSIRVSGSSSWITDTGYYSYYAGPVRTGSARGKCIDAKAQTQIGSNVFATSISGRHCG